MGDTWVYRHQDLGEPVHVDGSSILRPVVPLIVADVLPAVLGVLDSGSPISVASEDLFAFLGVDIVADEPCMRFRSALAEASSALPQRPRRTRCGSI